MDMAMRMNMELMEGTEEHKVKVAVRSRPLNPREKAADAKINWIIGPQSIQSIDPKTQKPHPKEIYQFDHVFGPEVATPQVYNDIVAPIVNKAFKGFNGTVICYGQTSSGKTHTLYGSENDQGIIDLLAQDIVGRMKADISRQFVIKVNLIEIYNENVKDLLNSENPVEIVETANGVVPRDIEGITVLSAEDISKAAQRLQRERRIGETRMNSQSSRSHTILRITIQIISQTVETDDLNSSSEPANGMVSAVLNFVDLAGSEKASQSHATGDRLKEASHINTSLSALSRVVMQLSEKWEKETKPNPLCFHSLQKPPPKSKMNSYVSYRDSKLTRLLQSSLSGDALVAIICNVTPASLDETTSTLRFACNAKKIKTEPKQNIIATADTSEYEGKIRELQYQLFGKNTELTALRQTLLRYTSHELEDRRMTFCPGIRFNQGTKNTDGSFEEFQPIPTRRSVGNSEVGACTAEVFKLYRESKVSQTTKKSVNPTSVVQDIIKSDQEAQTDFDEVPTPAKRPRLDSDESRTPISTVRLQRSILSVAIEDDRQSWKEQKDFLDSEIFMLKEEIQKLKEQIASNENDEAEKRKNELDALQSKYCREIEELKCSKEYEVNTLDAQIQKKNGIIKGLQEQVKVEEQKQADQNALEEVTHLKAELEERDKIIKELHLQAQVKIEVEEQADQNALEEVTHLKAELEERDKIIKELQLQAQVKELQEQADKNDLEEATHLKAELKERNKIIKELQVQAQVKELQEQADQNELKAIADEAKFAKDEIMHLKMEIEERDKITSITAEEIHLLTAQVAELRNLKDEVVSENVKLSEEINELKSKYSEEMQHEVDAQIQAKDSIIKDLETQAKLRMEEHLTMHEDVQSLKTKIVGLKGILQQQANERDTNEKDMKLLKDEITDLRSSKEDWNEQKDILNDEIQQLKDLIASNEEIVGENVKLSEEINELKSKYNEEMYELDSKIQAKDVMITDLETQVNLRMEEYLTVQESLESFKTEVNDLKEKLHQRDNETTTSAQEISLLKDEITDLRSSKENWNEQKDILNKEIQQLNELIATKDEAVNENVKLSEKINDLKAKYSKEMELVLDAQIQAKDLMIKDLETQVNLRMEEYLTVQESLESFKTEVNDLKEKLRQRDNERNNSAKEINLLKDEIIDLRSSKQEEWNEQNEILINTTRELEEIIASKDKVVEENVKLSEAINELKSRYSEEMKLELDAEIQAKDLIIKDLETEANLRMEENLTMQNNIESFKAEVKDLKGILHQVDNEKNISVKEICSLKAEIVELRNSKDILSDEIKKVNIDAKAKEKGSLNINLKYVESLKEDLKKCWKENSILSDQITDLKASLQSKEKELDSMINEFHELKSARVLKPAVLESLYAELEEKRQSNDKLKTDLDQMSESLRKSVEDNKSLNQTVEKLQNVRRPSRINRGIQTPVEWDLEKPIYDLKVRLKRSIYLLEKSDKKVNDVMTEKNRDLKKFQDELTEKSKNIEMLENYFSKVREEKDAVRKRQVEVGVQCQYIEELLVRSKGGESGLLPPEFPDVGQLLKDKERLESRSYSLEKALRKCQCNVDKNNRLLKLNRPTERKENAGPVPLIHNGEVMAVPETPFIPRMGSAADRKRPDWLRGAISTKTPSPSVFPRALSVLPPPDKPSSSIKKENIKNPSVFSIHEGTSSVSTSQTINSPKTPKLEQNLNMAKEHYKSLHASRNNTEFKTETTPKVELVVEHASISTSDVLKEYNKSVAEDCSNKPAGTPIATAMGSVPFKSIFDEENDMTSDEYYDWLMATAKQHQMQEGLED